MNYNNLEELFKAMLILMRQKIEDNKDADPSTIESLQAMADHLESFIVIATKIGVFNEER